MTTTVTTTHEEDGILYSVSAEYDPSGSGGPENISVTITTDDYRRRTNFDLLSPDIQSKLIDLLNEERASL